MSVNGPSPVALPQVIVPVPTWTLSDPELDSLPEYGPKIVS